MESSLTDEVSQSAHWPLRGTPGRRPPPRTRSSGMAAISRGDVPGFMQQPPRPSEPDDRRRLFRTTSLTLTNSFLRTNKPNRVLSLQCPRPGDQIEPNSVRGTSSIAGPGTGRRGSLQRAKLTTALAWPVSVCCLQHLRRCLELIKFLLLLLLLCFCFCFFIVPAREHYLPGAFCTRCYLRRIVRILSGIGIFVSRLIIFK